MIGNIVAPGDEGCATVRPLSGPGKAIAPSRVAVRSRWRSPILRTSRTAMSTTQDLVNALKSELRAAGVTYADLADALGHVGVERQARIRQGGHAAVAHRRDAARSEDGFRRAGAQGRRRAAAVAAS